LALASLYESFVAVRHIAKKKNTVSGTLRSNLDPFGLHDDDRLLDALRRSYLIDTPKNRTSEDEKCDGIEDNNSNQTSINRFTLDTVIEDEGNNLSMGQVSHFTSMERQLLTIS
jgi:ABC-type multidrug transport system fused ATPase/permease subunit